MSRKKRSKQPGLAEFFLQHRKVVILVLSFVVINVIVSILSYTLKTLELRFLFSKMLWVTFFLPALAWTGYDMVCRLAGHQEKRKPGSPYKKHDTEAWNAAKAVGSVASMLFVAVVTVFFVVQFAKAAIDLCTEAIFVQGKVLRVDSGHRSPTVVYLEGRDRGYELNGTAAMDVMVGRSYRFRYMPASRICIPVEELPIVPD